MKRTLTTLLLLLMLFSAGCTKTPSTDTGTDTPTTTVVAKEDFNPTVEALADDMLKSLMTLSPINATLQIGDLSKYGLTDLASQMDHMSLSSFDDYYAAMDGFGTRLDAIDPSTLTPENLRLYNKMKSDVLASKEERKYILDQQPINQNLGLQTAIPIVLTQLPLTTEEEVQAYLSRITQFKRLMEECATFIEEQIKIGSLMTADLYDKSIQQCNEFVAIDPLENTLYLYLNDQLSTISTLDATKKQAYLDECVAIITDQIYPSYKTLVASLEKAKAATTITSGLWQYPDGKDYYAYLVKKETATDMTPEEMYQWASDAFTNGITKMTGLYTQLNDQGLNIEDAFKLDPKYTKFTELYDILNGIISDNFNSYDIPPVSEKIIPSYLEKDLPEGFYLPVTIDGLKLGNMFLKQDAYNQVNFETLILLGHEAIPGHHFQHSILVNLPLTAYQKVADESAYIEGWASYVETLVSESLFKDQPLYAQVLEVNFDLTYSMLSLMDYDLHYGGLSRQEVIDKYAMYMGEETDKSVDRALVSPGETLHYAYGRYEILALREMTKKALGDAFDIKAFHHVILSAGPCSMTDLEQIVKDYIVSQVPSWTPEAK